MNVNLLVSHREKLLLGDSIVTRIRTVEGLINGWEQHPDEHTPFLVETYSKDLADLNKLLVRFN